MEKVLTETGLTKLIQLSKDEFLPKSNVATASTVTLADVAFSGSYADLMNLPTNLVTHTTNTAVGSGTQPVYIASDGTAIATTYALNKTVPSDAVFTDTLNTAGSTNTSSKIFLIGATSQGANPQTYSQDTAFIDINGRLNSAAPATDANDTTVATTKWVKDQGYTTDAFPSQSGNSGKFLTTNGSTVSWATITIPTVNNGTLTIQSNGNTVGTFTANSSSNVTANIASTQVVWRTYS